MIKKTYISPIFKVVEVESKQLICESMSIYDEESGLDVMGAKRNRFFDDYESEDDDE